MEILKFTVRIFRFGFKMSFLVKPSPKASVTRSVGLVQYALSIHMRNLSSCPNLLVAVQGKSKDASERTGIQKRFGEDSWFSVGTPKAVTIGVADGVGGWRKDGIDSGKFADELMSCCCHNAQSAEYDGKDARKLLVQSFDQMKNNHVFGSSTACLLALDRSDCMLHTANLGDSGFLVVRNKALLYRSTEQEHGFNTPYQLAVPPNKFPHKVHCDAPEKAMATHLKLRQGDMVLLATDGLFDNVPLHLLVRVLGTMHGTDDINELQALADVLVDAADQLAHIETFQSPFCMRARYHQLPVGTGGKPDDITVILGSVSIPQNS